MTEQGRRIDHLVLAVHDLERAAALYERLGFQVGARNRHPWGTENRLVQLQTSFLELISLGNDPGAIAPHRPGFFSFGAFVRDYLSEREGVAMFVLDSDDAAADAKRYADAGIGRFEPFTFERAGRAADGTETRVAFTLAFAVDGRIPDAAFFVCQQHYPEAFWSPALQQHPNGATDVSAVTLALEDRTAHADFLRAFAGSTVDEDGRLPLGGGGHLELRNAPERSGFEGLTIAVADVDGLLTRLRGEQIPFDVDAAQVQVDPRLTFGAAIRFAPTSSTARPPPAS